MLINQGSTKKFLCKKQALNDLVPSWLDLWDKKSFYLVSDENTFALCGEVIKKAFMEKGIAQGGDYCFPGSPVLHGEYSYVKLLTEKIMDSGDTIPLVIGSGTLNDLVKRAAFEAERGYAVVATAASVDGYASDGAALLAEGVKQTFPCPAPELIIADLDLLFTAPPEMTSSGYGDLAGKVPAGADWILADILGEQPIHEKAWSLVHDKLDKWLSDPKGITHLFDGLTQAGLAMQLMKNSRPVSGAEHLISHVWEMEGRTLKGKTISHGHKVAMGTVWMMKLYTYLLENPPSEERTL